MKRLITMAAAAAMTYAVKLSDDTSPDTAFANIVEFLEILGKENGDFLHYANPEDDFKDKGNIAKAWEGLLKIRDEEIAKGTGTV